MDITELTDQFYELIAPNMPSETDVVQCLQPLVGSREDTAAMIFQQVPVLWSVSHTLCFLYLENVLKGIPLLTLENLDIYVKELIDRYRNGGFRAVSALLDNVRVLLPKFRGKNGLRLDDVHLRLQPYLNGLAGRHIPLIASGTTCTDTESIFVPWELNLPEKEEAFFLYKFIISFQWASLETGTLSLHGLQTGLPAGNHHPLQDYFHASADSLVSMQLYHFFETIRTLAFLGRELPGLMRSFPHIARIIRSSLPKADSSSDFILQLQHQLLEADNPAKQTELMERVHYWTGQCRKLTAQRAISLRATEDVAPLVLKSRLTCEAAPLPFQGEFRFAEVMAAKMRQQKRQHNRFLEHFTISRDKAKGHSSPSHEPEGDHVIVLLDKEAGPDVESAALTKETVDNIAAVIPAVDDTPGQQDDIKSAAGEHALPCFVYDEWDKTRRGYRRDWCKVTEKPLYGADQSFIKGTLDNYRVQINQLKKQFERLRTGDRLLGRQQEGDDIDLDAMIESMADFTAGLSPSDRLFLRRVIDQRDVSVIFLADMSSSTEGWIGRAIKEALLLLSEAMEKLGDQFGIYGFSGKQRLGCEIFPIKQLKDSYSPVTRERIAAMTPKDFTRMGAAIRHMTRLFKKAETKLRLLVIISDGKPHDSDDYKDEYAVEDTRRAVFEAMAAGINPFCITIDEKAPTYMHYLFGPTNFVFVDDVRKLPTYMPRLYQILTT